MFGGPEILRKFMIWIRFMKLNKSSHPVNMDWRLLCTWASHFGSDVTNTGSLLKNFFLNLYLWDLSYSRKEHWAFCTHLSTCRWISSVPERLYNLKSDFWPRATQMWVLRNQHSLAAARDKYLTPPKCISVAYIASFTSLGLHGCDKFATIHWLYS